MSDDKLTGAMTRIRAILDELDIAGVVILHNAPTELNVFTKMDPSYSILRGLPPVVRIRSKLEDYGGDVDAATAARVATASMVRGFGEIMGRNAIGLMELSQLIDDELGATHSPLRSTDGH